MDDPGPQREIWQCDGAAVSQYERCAVPFLLGPWGGGSRGIGCTKGW
jgi:hypothetical protein